MLKNILFTSLVGFAMVLVTGCTDGKDAATEKCNAGKCDSAKKVTKKCDGGKCDSAKKTAPKPDSKCGEGKCGN